LWVCHRRKKGRWLCRRLENVCEQPQTRVRSSEPLRTLYGTPTSRWDPILCNVQYFMRTKLGLHFVIVEFVFRGRETWRTATSGRGFPQGGWVLGGVALAAYRLFLCAGHGSLCESRTRVQPWRSARKSKPKRNQTKTPEAQFWTTPPPSPLLLQPE